MIELQDGFALDGVVGDAIVKLNDEWVKIIK